MLIKATFECGRWNHNDNEYAHNDYAYDDGDDDDGYGMEALEMVGNMVLPSNFESNCDEWNDATNLPAILILNEDHPDDHPVMMMVQTMIDK